MMQMEATDLASKLAQTWRGGPQTNIWEEELQTLNARQAEVAYQKIRRTSKAAPSISEFLDAYQALGGGDIDQSACTGCRGIGWLDLDDHDARRHHNTCSTPADCGCTAMIPCGCKDGARARIQHAQITRRRAARADPTIQADTA